MTSQASVTPAGRGDCPSGKVQFATRKQARKARSRTSGNGLNIYPCPRCGWLHVGHLPQRVRAGEVDKADWLDSKSRKRRRTKPSATFTPSDLARIVSRKQESA